MAKFAMDPLSKENYDTWKMQMEALLTETDSLQFVDGTYAKPEVIQGNAENAKEIKTWISADKKARAKIILSISPSELKQIKNCITSNELWTKLESIYQSKGPARKASLLKRLTLTKMKEDDNAKSHLDQFFDAVDKLSEMDLIINDELLAIMLLYSLPDSFENFRCAIESRDELPTSETLRIKIKEESEARKGKSTDVQEDAMLTRRFNPRERGEQFKKTGQSFMYKCYRCKKVGHKAVDCRSTVPEAMSSELIEEAAFQGTTNPDNSVGKWCLDSGATSHMSAASENLESMVKVSAKLSLASNAMAAIENMGDLRINVDDKKGGRPVILQKMLHVPDLRTNLMSVAKITDNGNEVIFKKEKAYVLNSEKDVIAVADRQGDLYFVKETRESASVADPKSKSKLMEWHERLGHVNETSLRSMANENLVLGMKLPKNQEMGICEICIKGKQAQTPFKNSQRKSKELLEIVHTDICGPMRTKSIGGAQYFAVFIDDLSRWCEVHFLAKKSDVFGAFKKYASHAENITGKKIKFLQSDNGTEYLTNEFEEYLNLHGIQRRLTVPHTPEQNGVAERKNRSLVETTRCLLLQSKLQPRFWAEAINTANYIRNRCPSRTLDGETPYKCWTGRRPSVSHCRPFGTMALALNKDPKKGKFQSRSKECYLLGYSVETKAYRLWSIDDQKTIRSRDVKFLDKFHTSSENFEELVSDTASTDQVEKVVNEPEHNDDDNIDHPTNHINLRKGPGRPRVIRNGRPGRPRMEPNMVAVEAEAVDIQQEAEAVNIQQEANFTHAVDPVNLKDAMEGPDLNEWTEAVVEEYKAHMENGTWDIVDLPSDKKPIGTRFVFKTKLDKDGNIDRRKARLVAKGFTQIPGTDFQDTFAPVIRSSSIRLMMAISVEFDLIVHQMDVVTAFLNGEVEEELYMEVPEKLPLMLEKMVTQKLDPKVRSIAEKWLGNFGDGNEKTCRVRKAIYGLRQSGRQWYRKLDSELKKLGLTSSKADPCLYTMKKETRTILLAVYVDDIIIATNNIEQMNELKQNLVRTFKMKDMGPLSYCLGIEFKQDIRRKTISMSQTKYTKEVILRFGMENSKPTKTPLDGSVKLKKAESEEVNDENLPYQNLIGSLMYLAVSTRPDISYAVSALSQFNTNYGKEHWNAAKRVLRYLNGTSEYKLVYKPTKKMLEGFVDADWAGCSDDRRSYTGYAFILAGAAVSWEAKKQRTVALSTTEAEYMALAEGSKEAIYLRSFLQELEMEVPKVVLFNDNQGAGELVKNPIFHSRTKHTDIRHHFIRDAYEQQKIEPKYMRTEDMTADILTKALFAPKHLVCVKSLGISESHY